VIAIIASTPSWRTLKKGVSDGSDVHTLEKALQKLGYGDDLTVDDHFTSATANAVKEWEKDLGRSDPNGEVDPSEILLVSRPSQVVDQSVQLGQAIPDGTQVLTVAMTSRVVTVNVDADDAASWHKNATVSVQWPDDSIVSGRVSKVGRDVQNGTVQVTVVPRTGELDHRSGTSAEVTLVTNSRKDVLAVPVSALGDDAKGRPAVTVISNGVSSTRSVTLGLVAQGWVQVTAGLQAGERVWLPGG
jgi:peptidoglycan hydrolase-like protein with peptidoglycan-binding domain